MGTSPIFGGNPDDITQALSNADPTVAAIIQKVKGTLTAIGVPTLFATTIAGSLGGIAYFAIAGFGLIVKILVELATPLLLVFLNVLTKARTTTADAQAQISAAVLSEFLATDLQPSHVTPGKTADAALAVARDIGNLLHNRLEHEFAPNGTVTPDTGAVAARTFSGYAVNFGVQNALLSQLAEACSAHYLEHFRELGEETARNLGLGRLQRQAMGPLIDNTIRKPYDRFLRKKYRQDLLPASNYVHAFLAGRLTRDQLSEKLGQLGFAEDDITELTLQLDNVPPLIDLVRLVRHGQMTQDAAIAILQNHGWPQDIAKQTFQAAELARVDTHVSTYCNLAVKQYVQGFIDEPAFQKLLENAPITDDERQWLSNVAGMELEAGRRRITFAQLETGLIAGIVDWDYVDTWMAAEGYDQDSQLVLQYELLLKLGVSATKAQITSTGAKSLAASKPPKAG